MAIRAKDQWEEEGTGGKGRRRGTRWIGGAEGFDGVGGLEFEDAGSTACPRRPAFINDSFESHSHFPCTAMIRTVHVSGMSTAATNTSSGSYACHPL